MQNVLIIEDEELAANRLKGIIESEYTNFNVLDICDSVESSVSFLEKNTAPDLIFMDIQLADGLSFSIFDEVEVTSPIIFITAYEEYAIRAFKVNSVDYLLKPINLDDFKFAIEKFQNINSKPQPTIDKSVVDSIKMALSSSEYKQRFMVKVGQHLKSVPTKSILYFYSMQKGTFFYTNESKNYTIDFTLDTIKGMVSPTDYFRVNRSHFVSHAAIKDIVIYSNSRLKLTLEGWEGKDVIVSREKVNEFKYWLES